MIPLTREQKQVFRPVLYILLATLVAVSVSIVSMAFSYPAYFWQLISALPWFLIAITFGFLEMMRRMEIKLGFRSA